MAKAVDNRNRSHMLFHVLLAVFLIAQIAAFIFYFNYGKIAEFRTLGALIWIFSFLLGWIPIYTFRKKAGVPKGSRYVKTTKLIDTGIYSIIRHPQYLAGILLSLAFMLISQNLIVIFLGIPPVIIFYLGAYDEDRFCIKKFGKQYKNYMNRVPRMNFVLGIIRYIGKKEK